MIDQCAKRSLMDRRLYVPINALAKRQKKKKKMHIFEMIRQSGALTELCENIVRKGQAS